MESKSLAIFESQIQHPLVTIAIPTFNRGEMLIDAIQSALSQTCNEELFDILVVDNNPERGDNTEKLMERYKDNYKISYFKNETNIGPIGNWRRLYELAKGEYVVMLHDDDMLFPHYLHVVLSFKNQMGNKYGLIYPRFYFANNRTMPNIKTYKRLIYREMRMEDYLVFQSGLPSGLFIGKKDYNTIGGFSLNLYPINDQEFIYRALHFVKGAHILIKMCFYYIGENTSKNPEVAIEGIVQANNFNKIISEDNHNRWRKLAHICKRDQISNICRWVKRFGNNEVLNYARKKIHLEKNILKDTISFIIAKTILLYMLMRECHIIKLDPRNNVTTNMNFI